MALACRPSLLIADRAADDGPGRDHAGRRDGPDHRALAREREMATLFITHDLALAADHCDLHRRHARRAGGGGGRARAGAARGRAQHPVHGSG
jgi:predicted ABC-type transport system involved in lysophospholipase L1 biosynthesis ATPase subunit